MKIKKLLTSSIVIICFMMMISPMIVHAAAGRISFTDIPSTPAGEEFEINMVISSEGEAIESALVELAYDNAAIEFVSGDGMTAGAGTLTYEMQGDGSETELTTTLTFRALKMGETKITINQVQATVAEGEALEATEGSSTINVEGGTEIEASGDGVDAGTSAPVEGLVASVDGLDYSVSSTIPTEGLPEGYTVTEIQYQGAPIQAAQGDVSGVTLINLVDAQGAEKLFCYSVETDTVWPYVQMNISDTSYIVLTREPITTTLPVEYQETVLIVSEAEFPTWQNTKNSDYYLLNAINSSGQTAIYQYDNADGTFQRFVAPEGAATEEAVSVEEPTGIMKMVEEYFVILVAIIAAILLLLLVIIIVMAVKLGQANKELDELYAAYEDEEERNYVSAANGNKKSHSEREVYTDHEDKEERRDKKNLGKNISKSVTDEYDDELEYDDDFTDEIEIDLADEFDDNFEGGFDDDFQKEAVQNDEFATMDLSIDTGLQGTGEDTNNWEDALDESDRISVRSIRSRKDKKIDSDLDYID